MAVYQRVLQHTASRVESPAKVFAKLKSKVDREASCGKDGIYSCKDLLGKVKEKLGADFKSLRKSTECNWISDEFNENGGYGSVCEARPLTISPMSSPQRHFGYSRADRSGKLAEDALSVDERGRGCTPRNGRFLDSTAKPQPFSPANRTQSLTEPLLVRDAFDVIHRTQRQRIQEAENELMLEEVRPPPMPSSCVFSPMRSKLRKRKLESRGLHNTNSKTRQVDCEPCPLGELQSPRNTRGTDPVHLRGFPARQLDKNQLAHEPVFPAAGFPAKTRSSVVEDKAHLMSPAKMFAYMKERESQAEQDGGRKHTGSKKLFESNYGNFRQFKGRSSPAVQYREEDAELISAVEGGTPASPSDLEPAESQSDADPSEDARVPAAPSHRVLLEDSLILNSPQVSIPKKHRSEHRNKNWPPLPADDSSVNGIHLKRWFLRRKGKDLFVQGIHRERNIPYNSNIIVDRLSACVLRTITGNFYILEGKMNLHANTGFPKWFLKKFNSGFPSNWNKLYEKFLSTRKEERNSKGGGSLRQLRSEANFIVPPPPVAHKATKAVKTPENRPAAPSSSAKVSRSGRLIKPPLEYWKGGRVLLDAHMNVTIHESYDTSLCSVGANTTVSVQPSALLFSPCGVVEHPPRKAAAAGETAGPLRKVKAPVRRRNRAGATHLEKPSLAPEAPAKPSRPCSSSRSRSSRSKSSSSSEGARGRRQRSSQRGRAVERALRTNGNVHKQTAKSLTPKKPRRQKRDSKKPPVTASRRKPTVLAAQRSPDSDASAKDPSSPKESIATQRSRRRKGAQSDGEEESQRSRKGAKKTTRALRHKVAAKAAEPKQSKANKTSAHVKPAQSTRGRKADGGDLAGQQEEEDERDEWTDSELRKLKEAVTVYPHHQGDHWAKVARTVGTRSAEECHFQHALKNVVQSPVRKQAKKLAEAKRPDTEGSTSQDKVVISARVGTLRRKKQVRQFLENMPREDNFDMFTHENMKNKVFQRAPTCSLSTTKNHDFTLSNLEPLTPVKESFPRVKTPHALPMSPDMLGSPNCENDDKVVFNLQKKVKRNQVNVCKKAPKDFKVTPSATRAVKRCGNTENDNFVVWEMFPGKNFPTLSDSEEEKDFYFSDDD